MATYYWVNGNGTWNNTNTTNWSNATGGSGGFGPPLSTDIVVFDSASGAGTCTTASGSTCATATLNSSTLGLTLGANHTMSGSFTLTLGTLTVGDFILTCSTFSSNNSNVRSISFGTGSIDLTGSSNTIWNNSTSTNFTISGTSTVNCIYAGSTGTRTLNATATEGQQHTIRFFISSGSDAFAMAAGSYNTVDFTGYTGTTTIATATRAFFGDFILAPNMAFASGTNTTRFASVETQKIKTNGVVLDFPIRFENAGTRILQDNLTVGSTRTVTLDAGTLDLNNNTLSCGLFASNNSNTRSIAFGTGNITLTGSGATIWSMGTMTGFTYTGTSTVNSTYSGSTGTRTFACGGTAGVSESNAISFNITSGTDTVAIGGGGATNNLDFTGFTGTFAGTGAKTYYGNLTFGSGMTVGTATAAQTFASTSGTKIITTNNVTIDQPLVFNGIGGTWSFADALTQGSTRAFTITNGTVKLKAGATSTVGAFATSGSNQKYLQSTTAGSQATLSQASGTVNASYLTIKDINATGGATWNAYRSLNNIDAGNNTGWDFLSTPVTTTTLAMRLGFGL